MAYRDLDRPPLDSGAIRAALTGPGRFWTDVVVTTETGNTIADVAAAARAGAPEGTVHTTDAQVVGRGELQRPAQVGPGTPRLPAREVEPPQAEKGAHPALHVPGLLGPEQRLAEHRFGLLDLAAREVDLPQVVVTPHLGASTAEA